MTSRFCHWRLALVHLMILALPLIAQEQPLETARFSRLSELELQSEGVNPLEGAAPAFATEPIRDRVFFSNYHASLSLRDLNTAPVIRLSADSELFLTQDVSAPLVVSLVSYERGEVLNRLLQIRATETFVLDEFREFDEVQLLSGMSFQARLLNRDGRQRLLDVLEPMPNDDLDEMMDPQAAKNLNPVLCSSSNYGLESMNLNVEGAICYATRYCYLETVNPGQYVTGWRAIYEIHYPLRGQIWSSSDDTWVSYDGCYLTGDLATAKINPSRPGPYYLRHAWMNLAELFNNRGGNSVVHRIDSCNDGLCEGPPEITIQGGASHHISICVLVDHVVWTWRVSASNWSSSR